MGKLAIDECYHVREFEVLGVTREIVDWKEKVFWIKVISLSKVWWTDLSGGEATWKGRVGYELFENGSKPSLRTNFYKWGRL